jgi:hypothetical protein
MQTARHRWVVTAAVASLVASAGLFGPAATAAAAVPLGGGAVIGVGDGYCTLTTIGHDNTGALVGFTAAHCGGLGAQVRAAGRDGPVGSVVGANGDLDYAVIKFDPAKVAAIANFAGFAINGIGPDPDPFQQACWFGAFTGNVCSHFNAFALAPRRNLTAEAQPGDDGGPVTSNDLLIGMIVQGLRATKYYRVAVATNTYAVVQRDPCRPQRQRRPGRRVHTGPGLTQASATAWRSYGVPSYGGGSWLLGNDGCHSRRPFAMSTECPIAQPPGTT